MTHDFSVLFDYCLHGHCVRDQRFPAFLLSSFWGAFLEIRGQYIAEF